MAQQNRGWWIALLVLGLIVVLVPTLGGAMMGFGVMGPGMMGWWGGQAAQGTGWAWGLAMGLGALAMLAFWGAIIVGIVLLVRTLSRPAGTELGPREESALDILKRRYAAGDLTHVQYEEMRRALHH